jgi:hypothetical protein
MAEGNAVPPAAAAAAAQDGHGCANCDSVTEVELIYFKLEYPTPGGKPGRADAYGHAPHLARLAIYRGIAKPTDLWGKEIKGKTLEEKCKAIQDEFKKTPPNEDYVKKTPERSGSELIYSSFGLNWDVGKNGGDMVPGSNKWSIPTWEEVPKRAGEGLWTYDTKAAYGLAPRLRVYKGWGGTPKDTLVRFHAGREYKAALKAGGDGLARHISVDRAGRWTDLRGTHGCLRVSVGDMIDMHQALRKYSSLNFTHTPPRPGNPLTEWEAKGKRSGSRKQAPPHFAVMYLWAEGKAGWCAADEGTLNQRFQVAVRRVKGMENSTAHICDTATWTNAQVAAFHKANPDQ